MQAFVPKTRRPKFTLHLRILDLNNVPYVSGRSYIKWSLPASAADGEHTGRTSKLSIKDHKVLYNYDTRVPVRMVIDKNGMLQETLLHFIVIHEVSHHEKVQLGLVRMNLAEYVDASEQDEEGVLRRYLMQESKINSTLKIGIFLKQVEGDRSYNAPPLRMAPVFSGIAGLVVGEVEDNDGPNMPIIHNSKTSQVAHDELRELYRRTIAANWTCLPGEFSADKVVEDIFSGGDGWLGQPSESGKGSGAERLSEDDGRGSHTRPRAKSGRHWFSRSRQDVKRRSKEDNLHRKRADDSLHPRSAINNGVIRGRSSFESQASQMGGEADKGTRRITNEFDELNVREDLRSWRLPS